MQNQQHDSFKQSRMLHLMQKPAALSMQAKSITQQRKTAPFLFSFSNLWCHGKTIGSRPNLGFVRPFEANSWMVEGTGQPKFVETFGASPTCDLENSAWCSLACSTFWSIHQVAQGQPYLLLPFQKVEDGLGKDSVWLSSNQLHQVQWWPVLWQGWPADSTRRCPTENFEDWPNSILQGTQESWSKAVRNTGKFAVHACSTRTGKNHKHSSGALWRAKGIWCCCREGWKLEDGSRFPPDQDLLQDSCKKKQWWGWWAC